MNTEQIMWHVENYGSNCRADGSNDCDHPMTEKSEANLKVAIKQVVNERDAAYERAAKTVESYCGAWDDNGFALATAIRALKEQA
jgi:hypothetical protein